MRCWAYQWSVCQKYNIAVDENTEDDNLRGLLESAKYVNAFCFYRSSLASDHTDYNTWPSEDETIDRMTEEVRMLSETTFTFDHFRKAWDERMEVLRKT